MRSEERRFTRPTTRLLAGVVFAFLAGALAPVQAQDATWLLNPGSGDINTAANWTPATVPTGTATFGQSNTTTLSLSASTAFNTLQFNAGAPAYTFNLSGQFMGLDGAGIVNSSSNVPILNPLLSFCKSATRPPLATQSSITRPAPSPSSTPARPGTQPSIAAAAPCCRSATTARPAAR